MALLWCDGFDHYGTSTTKMLDGVYAEIGGDVSISTTNPRTGANHIRIGGGGSQAQSFLRRVLGGAKTTVGMGAAFYLLALPTGNNCQRIFGYNDATNVLQLALVIQSTGTIEAWRGTPGTGTSLGVTASPVVVANAYQHIEAVVFFSQTVGTVEVRVNGVTVLSISGVDTCNTALTECSQVFIGGAAIGTQTNQTTYIDDVFCYDNTSSYNNTFIGDRRVLTLFPDANTATADWTAVGAASGYLCIDEAAPNDDTDYITAATVGLVSQFGLQNLPSGISVVNAVVMVERARKTEAGTANTKVSIVSGASNTAGADKPLTEVYTYRQDVFQTDPASAAPFTPANVDALQFKVERTA
jgi:ABC-type amino acid transport system permease subunit